MRAGSKVSVALLLICATALPSQLGASTSRKRLTAATTQYFVRTDGAVACDGLANAAAGAGSCAWPDLQYALDWTRDNLDFAGKTVEIRFGETSAITWNAPVGGYFCNGGYVGLKDAASFRVIGTPSNAHQNTTIDGAPNSTHAFVAANGCKVTLQYLVIKAHPTLGVGVLAPAGIGGNTGAGTAIEFSDIRWNGAMVDIYASRWSYITQVGPDHIQVINPQGHVKATHEGQFRNYNQSTTVTVAGAYGTRENSFAYAAYGGKVVYTGAAAAFTFSDGAVTGGRGFAEYNGVIEQPSKGLGFLPGNVNVGTATGGQYNP